MFIILAKILCLEPRYISIFPQKSPWGTTLILFFIHRLLLLVPMALLKPGEPAGTAGKLVWPTGGDRTSTGMLELEVIGLLHIWVLCCLHKLSSRPEGGGLICKAYLVLALEPSLESVGRNAQVIGNLAFRLALGYCLNSSVLLLDGLTSN